MRATSASCFLGVIISFRSEPNDTRMHISRGEARTPTHPAHEPSSHREAQTDVARSTSCFAVSLSLSGYPFCLQTAWGARQVDYRPAHARASLVPDHAKGTVVLPLGAQQVVSQIAKNKFIPHHPQQQPVSSQRTTQLIPCLSSRLPTSCHLNLRLSSFTAACLFFPPQIPL